MKTKPLFYGSQEFRLTVCRDGSNAKVVGDTPERISEYLYQKLKVSPFYRPDRENFIVILLDVRRKIIGFEIITTGLLDTVLIHAREIFRPAILQNAHAIVVAHNHPSNDVTPSEADIRTTRDLIRAGQILKIELLDSLIIGDLDNPPSPAYCSLRTLGHFYT